ncbi:hypothetical protein ACHAXT_004359 [Thalassiosira profunda]
MLAVSLAGVSGSTLLVVATTAVDAIWLVPYMSPSLPLLTRITHGVLFVATFECLVAGSVGVAVGMRWAVEANEFGEGDAQSITGEGKRKRDIVLGSIAAAICWVVAIALYLRKVLKRRRRAEAMAMLHRATTQRVKNTTYYGTVDDCPECHAMGWNAPLDEEDEDEEEKDKNPAEEEDMVSRRPSPFTVVSLTALGSLDEVSYFPSLVLGSVFSPLDLCLGTLVASCIILLAISLLLSTCGPLLHWLDRIPLYGIVAAFALVLTVSVVLEDPK